jgi:hypothetical protein
MQEKWVFESESIKKVKEFKPALLHVLHNHMNELEIFLSQYTKPDGAIAENVQFLAPEELTNAQSGFFSLGYNKVFFNACLNINESDLDRIKLKYHFNADEGQLILTGPDFPEREPDEI